MSQHIKGNSLEAYISGITYFDLRSKIEFRTVAKSNDPNMINAIKSGQRSLLTKFKIKKFSCSICKDDYEMCCHEEGSTYEGNVCAPLMTDWEFERVLVMPRASNSKTRVTDMLVITNDGTQKQYTWYSYPNECDRKTLKNLKKALNKGWIELTPASHFEKLFNISSEGVVSYPPKP